MSQGSWFYNDYFYKYPFVAEDDCYHAATIGANEPARGETLAVLRNFCFPPQYSQCQAFIKYEQLWGIDLPVNGTSLS